MDLSVHRRQNSFSTLNSQYPSPGKAGRGPKRICRRLLYDDACVRGCWPRPRPEEDCASLSTIKQSRLSTTPEHFWMPHVVPARHTTQYAPICGTNIMRGTLLRRWPMKRFLKGTVLLLLAIVTPIPDTALRAGGKTHEMKGEIVSVDLEGKTITFKDEKGEEHTAPVMAKALETLKTLRRGDKVILTGVDSEKGEHEAVSEIRVIREGEKGTPPTRVEARPAAREREEGPTPERKEATPPRRTNNSVVVRVFYVTDRLATGDS